jgi:hypothetical protein
MRLFLSLISLPIFSSCFFAPNSDGVKLNFFQSKNKQSFSFVVSERFLQHHQGSESSALYPAMTNAELRVLMKNLRNNKYCINKDADLSFKIKSKQEKIYDITFSGLIEQNYNAKPISPVTYFGECI